MTRRGYLTKTEWSAMLARQGGIPGIKITEDKRVA